MTTKMRFQRPGGTRAVLLGMACLALASVAQAAPQSVPAVQARAADAFIDSIGVNGLGGPYVFHYGGDRARLYNTRPVDPRYLLGVRHARFEIRPDTDLAPMINLANDQGTRIDALVSWLWTDPVLNKSAAITNVFPSLRRLPPGSIDTIEGNNESDMPFESGDFPRYASSLEAAPVNQAALYHAVKADPQFRNTPVIAWTLGKNWPWGGNIGYGQYTSTDFDYESMHSYTAGDTIDGSLHNPGHNQWLKVADSIVPPGGQTKPIIATETGFTQVVAGPDKVEHDSSRAQAKQEMMLLAQYFSLGIVRTFLYSVGGERQWSMDTRDDGTPLPAGRALSYLTATLGEAHWDRTARVWRAPHFKPAALAFSLSPVPPSIHSLLLQKSDGAFYLLLWNDVLVWDGKTFADLNNPPVSVTLSFHRPDFPGRHCRHEPRRLLCDPSRHSFRITRPSNAHPRRPRQFDAGQNPSDAAVRTPIPRRNLPGPICGIMFSLTTEVVIRQQKTGPAADFLHADELDNIENGGCLCLFYVRRRSASPSPYSLSACSW